MTERRTTDDLFHFADHSQGDRNSEPMGEWHKNYEDTFHQGMHNTGKTNAPSDWKSTWQDVLPRGWEQVAPVNQPKHVLEGDWEQPVTKSESKSGVSLAYLTIDSEEHATRFVKDLFVRGIVSAVQMFDGGFERSYLKFGRPSTEKNRVRLEMVIPDDNIKKLIDFTNNNNPTSYDYPVPDLTVIPVARGNEKFIKWAEKPTKIDYKKVYE